MCSGPFFVCGCSRSPPRYPIVWTSFALLCLLSGDAEIATRPPSDGRIRILDAQMRLLFDAGMERSPTFRGLVARLNASDVVVYLRADPSLSSTLAGQLQYVSSVAGLRYVVVKVTWDADRPLVHRIAALGHELQHALEIADTPSIVDTSTLQQAYEAFGYLSRRSPASFETDGAIDVGRRVRKEVLRSFHRPGGSS